MREKVTILLPVYRSNPRYLEEQLRSLNAQTYENLELLVWNDCPEAEPDRELFARCVTRFPVRFCGGEKNLGYIGAFNRLSELAEGDYFSYCDQDDVWEPEKISACMEAIRESGALIAASDISLTDAEGNITCRSRREATGMACHNWKTGDDITEQAAFFCYGIGMTIVAKADAVKRVLPFVPTSAHDLQLMLFLSAAGKAAYVERPLVRYRRHGKNETGTLSGITRKQDYYDTRCLPARALIERFAELYPGDPRTAEMRKCCEARIRGDFFGILKNRRMIPDLYKYEAALALCPDFLFRRLKDRVAAGKSETGKADGDAD